MLQVFHRDEQELWRPVQQHLRSQGRMWRCINPPKRHRRLQEGQTKRWVKIQSGRRSNIVGITKNNFHGSFDIRVTLLYQEKIHRPSNIKNEIKFQSITFKSTLQSLKQPLRKQRSDITSQKNKICYCTNLIEQFSLLPHLARKLKKAHFRQILLKIIKPICLIKRWIIWNFHFPPLINNHFAKLTSVKLNFYFFVIWIFKLVM